MFHEEYLLQNSHINLKQKIHINQGKIIYQFTGKKFDIDSLKELIDFVKLFAISNFRKLPIDIILNVVEFTDKLIIVLLECVCYYLVHTIGSPVRISFVCDPTIWIEGVRSSPLLILNDFSNQNQRKFSEKFKKDYFRNHFRRLITVEENHDKTIASRVMQDVDSFLKFWGISEEYRAPLSEVIVELVDNALEHTETDCLIDLDVALDYKKVLRNNGETCEVSDDDYCGINIAIINFSKYTIGDKLKEKFSSNSLYTDRYSQVLDARKNHSCQWTTNYREDDFYLIASFQRGISSRSNSYTGGTGLTKLLQLLEKKSDAYNCYMLSGDKKLRFKHDYLNYVQEKWIGFNIPNDFMHNIPDQECFERSSFYIPGTAYNLNFVLRKSINTEEE